MSDAGGLGLPKFERPGDGTGAETRQDFRWLMSSDVCKHCTHAGCLDVCPTGALFRTEFGTVVVPQGGQDSMPPTATPPRALRQQRPRPVWTVKVGQLGAPSETFRRRKPAR
jgi:hypothetical protein